MYLIPLEEIRALVAGKRVAILLQGPSVRDARLDELLRLDGEWIIASLNKARAVEDLLPPGRGFDIVYCTAKQRIEEDLDWYSAYQGFLALSFEGWKLLGKGMIYQEEAPFLFNSITGLLYLLARGGAADIFIFGADGHGDGYHNEQLFDGPASWISRDTAVMNKFFWPVAETYGISLPRVTNVTPGSAISCFPILDQEAVVARERHDRLNRAAALEGRSTGLVWAPTVLSKLGIRARSSLWDLGCGNGEARDWFRARRVDAAGIDFSGRPDVEACLWLLPALYRRDFIYCVNVLEHIPEAHIDTVLRSAAALMGATGFFYIRTAAREDAPPAETLRPAAWWVARIEAHFAIMHLLQDDGFEAFFQGDWYVMQMDRHVGTARAPRDPDCIGIFVTGK
ncbi:methyltransferase domain-containing protein [Marinibaculum pumilum]|uniref:Methyltransferase domain-containing protein n=1 Tax=Marinibaculum pumilum TaxID=1766165 RepID=A0ABV7L2Y0_9PROT